MPDALGRPILAEGMKTQIAEAFKVVPEHKRGALLIVADADTKTARAHLAAKINGTWKVAGGAGWNWTGQRPSGWVGVEAVW